MPDTIPDPEPYSATAKPAAAPDARSASLGPILADAYTALPSRVPRRPRWALWGALAAALALSIIAARRMATPKTGAPAATAPAGAR